MAPTDPVHLFSFAIVSLLIVLSLISMMFLYPANYSDREEIRLNLEIKDTYLVIVVGKLEKNDNYLVIAVGNLEINNTYHP
jgi:hypothetical protein